MQLNKAAVLSAAMKDITRVVKRLERKLGVGPAFPATIKLAAAFDELARMRRPALVGAR
jgi:hypothetical protein